MALCLSFTACSPDREPAAPSPSPSPAAAERTEPVAEAPRDFVSSETEWRYFACVNEPSPGDDAAWTRAGFNDAAWMRADGSFGAKNGALEALGSYLPQNLLQMEDDAGDPIPTYLFRTTFSVDDPAAIPALEGALIYDDAIIVYLNGSIIFSDNLPEDGYDGLLSFGADAAQDEPQEGSFRIASTLLRAGDNTLAVELHQAAASSTDIYFDFVSLKSAAYADALSLDGLCLFTSGESALTVRWLGNGEEMQLYYAPVSEASNPVQATVNMRSLDGTTRYDAQLAPLLPGTEYEYWIKTPTGETPKHSFRTAEADSFSFLFVGDPQITGNKSADALNVALDESERTDFALFAGDLTDSSSKIEQYRMFLDTERLSSLPIAAVIGNHEGPALYDAYFAPQDVAASARDFSFSYGKTLFVCLDSNVIDASAHERFLGESVASGEWDWVIVCMHHSVFSIGKHAESGDEADVMHAFAKLFAKYDVDLVLSGHDHIYARTKLMDTLSPASAAEETLVKRVGQTLYLSAGSSTGSKYYERADEVDEAPFACVSEEERAMLTTIRVDASSIQLEARYTNDGSLFDKVTLRRETQRTKETAQTGNASPASPSDLKTALLASEAAYLESTALPNGALALYPAQDGENTVNPYFADYAALALLRQGRYGMVRDYIDWHIKHLNAASYDINALPYTIYDYTVLLQAGVVTGETASMGYDSTDSYAASFLLVATRYFEATQDGAYLFSLYPYLAGVIQVILSTENDGLTVARPDYRVRYLMDNCEVRLALEAVDSLLANAILPMQTSEAERANTEALRARVREMHERMTIALDSLLWNERESRYAYALFENGTAAPFDKRVFYPDSIAQLSPILYGLIDPASERARTLYETFCDNWSWETLAHIDTDESAHYWGMCAYCAAMMGDDARLQTYLTAYWERVSETHEYPLFNADAAWVMLACAYTPLLGAL